ncbi:unnamed protein product [Phyllotreta striolata]|uniref:Uncharacterized protein n=1 Tax=Phyllotreta striolata TaxID=444603 RepID=A0A9N9TJI2_PHYSR|nr:unnamed protein product [Phyllotreta striolata]
MASKTIALLVIFSLISQSLQSLDNNEIEVETDPYKEAADDIRKEQKAQTLGAMFQNAMENDGENLIGNFLSQFGKENAGQLLQGLGSVLNSQNDNKESDSPNIIESIGSIMSNMQNNNDDTTANLLQGLGGLLNQGGGNAALLQGLGSLLNQGDNKNKQGEGTAALLQTLGTLFAQGSGGKKEGGGAALLQGLGSLLSSGQGGIDPQLIGSVLNAFSDQGGEKAKEAPQKPRKTDEDFNMDDLLTLAGSFLGSKDQKNKQGKNANFLSMLPGILQTINTFMGPEADERAKGHEGHSWLMPPLLEKFHVLFDHFVHSEIGKQTIAAIGAEKSFKVFMDENGRFNYRKFGELMENLSYRRQWIRIVTDRIAEFIKYAAQPKVYKSYVMGGQLFFNSYIKSLGFPKSTHFDSSRPVETISAFVNYVGKKYFEVKINAKEHVKPAVIYITELMRLAEASGTMKSLSNSKELSDKLADTINLEVIEPLVRVNRAYRFCKAVPKCTRYVLCLVNHESENPAGESLPGLKKGLYRASSLAAGWFLSGETGVPFWTLYVDITNKADCKKLYFEECNEFHVEELRVTTEYVHNEL